MLNIACRQKKSTSLIEKFQKEQIIVKYQTIIDWEKAGVDNVTAVIEVKITWQSRL